MKRTIRSAYYVSRSYFRDKFNSFSDIHRLVILQATNWLELRKIWKLLLTPQRTVPTLRIGGEGDGGYCTPNALSGIDCFFSPGYGGMKEFEDDLAKHGIPSYICDGGFESINVIEGKQHFISKNLSPRDGEKTIALDTWIAQSDFSKSNNLGLQMDIEGSEYDILGSLDSTTLQRFKILLIEFHDLEILAVSSSHIERVSRVMNKILDTHFLVHVKSNNAGGFLSIKGFRLPNVIELSFVRKNVEVSSAGEVHIDCPYLNDETKSEILIPKI